MEHKSKPVLLQAFADALSRTTALDAHKWLAGDALRNAKPPLLWALVEAQVALADPNAIPALTEIFTVWSKRKDGAEIAAAAVRGLGAIGGRQSVATLLAAAEHPDTKIRRAAAQAIPPHTSLTDKLTVALRDLVRGSDARVRRAAYRGIGKAKLEALIPDLIIALESDPRLRNRQVAYVSLKRISGRDFSHDAPAWRRWWKDRENEEPGAFGAARKYTYARYYGFGVHTDRVVFVVDVSGSMNWSYHFSPKRIEVARRELDRVIREIHGKSLFNVVVYASKVKAWQRSEVEASPANVTRALKWAQMMLADPDGDTHTYQALEKTFLHNPNFDTIFFLSDGWPTHGDYISNEGIIAAVRVWNRDRDAVVHTIALTLENVDRGHPHSSTRKLNEMKEFLRQLAAATGGECKAVASAPP
jgi:hypothetical protein